jgi:60 kDa SS-A/Ro ribonucleoprotein
MAKQAYLINVASAKNGVGYGKPWCHLDGFSEGVLRFILAYEHDD